eukprot:SAG11_NODE_1388_length_5064_cov_4.336354_2_plen_613_part_00
MAAEIFEIFYSREIIYLFAEDPKTKNANKYKRLRIPSYWGFILVAGAAPPAPEHQRGISKIVTDSPCTTSVPLAQPSGSPPQLTACVPARIDSLPSASTVVSAVGLGVSSTFWSLPGSRLCTRSNVASCRSGAPCLADETKHITTTSDGRLPTFVTLTRHVGSAGMGWPAKYAGREAWTAAVVVWNSVWPAKGLLWLCITFGIWGKVLLSHSNANDVYLPTAIDEQSEPATGQRMLRRVRHAVAKAEERVLVRIEPVRHARHRSVRPHLHVRDVALHRETRRIDRRGQSPSGRHVTQQHGRHRVTSHFAGVVGLKHGGDVVVDPLRGQATRVDQHDDGWDASAVHGLDQIQLVARQREVGTVCGAQLLQTFGRRKLQITFWIWGKRAVARTVAFALHSRTVHGTGLAVLLPLGGVQPREDDGDLGLPREGHRGRDVPRGAVGAAHLDAGHPPDHLQLRPPLEPEQRRLREHEVIPSVVVGQEVGAGVEVRADRGDLELARRAARLERQQPLILQQYKSCIHPSRSGVADRAVCKRAVSPTLHRRVLRQPSLLDVINIRLAQPGPLGRHLLIREPERDHLGDGAVQRPVDIRLLQPPRSQVLSDVPAVVAAAA